MNELTLTPIAYIHNDFPEKFGIPRQSGLADTLSEIIFEKEYAIPEAFRNLEGFSYIWLIWGFSGNRYARTDQTTAEKQRAASSALAGSNTSREIADHAPRTEKKSDTGNSWHPTVRPPKLGGNTRVGVFASRSPFRPNPIGLSSVELIKIEYRPETGTVLIVKGADLMDGTPIYDVKPYLPYADSHPEAASGFAGQINRTYLQVHFPAELLAQIPAEKRPGLMDVLREDPRPSYQNDPKRIYGLTYGSRNIRFKVSGGELFVIDILRSGK